MNKFIAILMLAVAGVASAADVQLGVGRNHAVNADVTNVQVGTSYEGFRVAGVVENARNIYTSYGATADYSLASKGSLSVGVFGGVKYINATAATDGFAGEAGVKVSYALAPQTSLFAQYGRSFALDNKVKQFNGNTLVLGLNSSF